MAEKLTYLKFQLPQKTADRLEELAQAQQPRLTRNAFIEEVLRLVAAGEITADLNLSLSITEEASA